MYEEIDLDELAPVEIPYKVGGTRYILREAGEGAAGKYEAAKERTQRLHADGSLAYTEGMYETRALLVSLCLCQTESDGTLKVDKNGNALTVPLGLVKSWGRRQVNRLFDKAVEISELNLPDTVERLKLLMARCQARLKELEKGPTEDVSKNGLAATPSTCA